MAGACSDDDEVAALRQTHARGHGISQCWLLCKSASRKIRYVLTMQENSDQYYKY